MTPNQAVSHPPRPGIPEGWPQTMKCSSPGSEWISRGPVLSMLDTNPSVSERTQPGKAEETGLPSTATVGSQPASPVGRRQLWLPQRLPGQDGTGCGGWLLLPNEGPHSPGRSGEAHSSPHVLGSQIPLLHEVGLDGRPVLRRHLHTLKPWRGRAMKGSASGHTRHKLSSRDPRP